MTQTAASGVSRYRRLFAVPGVLRLLVLVTLARLPVGMTGLALLLLVQQERDSFADGGLVSAAYAGALAIAAPARGRAVDRRGGRSVLLIYGVAHPAALLAVLGAVLLGGPLPVLLLLTAVAGATFPPVSPLLRAFFSVVYDDEADRSTAYALDAVLIELSFVGGPVLVGLALAVDTPALAVATSAVLVAVGSLPLAVTPLTARLVPHPHHGQVPLRTPLTSPPVRRLLVALLLLGAGFGATEVAVSAHAVHAGAAHLAGPLLTLWALGSVLGGLAYGARHWDTPIEQQYPRLVTALAAAFVLPLAAVDSLTLAAALVIGGATIAPFSACNSALLARLAPTGTMTATFAWAGSFIVAGMALGVAASGWLVEHTSSGPVAGFALAAAAGAAAFGTTLAGHRLLIETST